MPFSIVQYIQFLAINFGKIKLDVYIRRISGGFKEQCHEMDMGFQGLSKDFHCPIQLITFYLLL